MKKILALCLTAALVLPGCVKVDNSLGKALVDNSLLYDTYTVEFPLEEIQLKMSDRLSGYSDSHLTIGAIRDETFGLTTRAAAFPLIPALDTLDLGKDPVAVSFSIYFEGDTVSVCDKSQERIFQNIYITELLEPLPLEDTRCTQEILHGTELITEGLPVYDGSGPLAVRFTQEFAQKYVDNLQLLGMFFDDDDDDDDDDIIDELLKDHVNYSAYVAALPGIYIETEEPDGFGGRINLFDFSCLSVSNNYYYRNDNIGRLTVNSEWDGVRKDSTFIFVPGEMDFINEMLYIDNNTGFSQYCFNRTTHETMPGKAEDKILVEGGGGLKPVILASELQEKTRAAIARVGGDPDKAIIAKATISLPYEMPEDYEEMNFFPSVLSPTICTALKDEDEVLHYTFAGLSDASVSTENQGDIDRSNLWYAPDITYHLQELLGRQDLTTATDADIWLLTIHSEQVAQASGSAADNSYLQSMIYASYYQSLYGGGYGYGGYGYGSGYNSYSNYYNYMMLSQMMAAASQQTYTVTTELDKDRYYRAILCGPNSARKPSFQVSFAIPKK